MMCGTRFAETGPPSLHLDSIRSRCARRHRLTREGLMDLIVRSHPALPARAWRAWRTRGAEYAWHKLLRRSLGRWPAWKRRWLYADPRHYWTLRGGDDYFREQEGQPARSRRIEWIAERLAPLRAPLDPGGRLRLRQAAARAAPAARRPAGRRRLQPDAAGAGPPVPRPRTTGSSCSWAAANTCRSPTVPSTWS